MNRRAFLKNIGSLTVVILLPRTERGNSLSGFARLAAECPTRPMTLADLEKGVEMLRQGWADPDPWWLAGGQVPLWHWERGETWPPAMTG